MEIVTRRFLLRDFTEAERPGFIAYHADPRYLALAGPDVADPQHSQRLFKTFRDWTSEQPRRNYQLAILQRHEPQALVGCCGLRGAGCESGKAELGIELAPAYWARHGYAIEVGRTLLGFGFGDLGLQEICGVTVDANARIARLAEWFGAEAVATRAGAAWMSARGWNETEWRITRDQWRRGAV
jgi:ribosomal-protein-alanine N-acetyltransferase